ncbi:Ciliary neurotrophic factor [Trichinella spiralis]|uniref:Ciliary neurotrophic factor n=1 Tax=Trichinella spiralis TaxID=6334 RepID=A0ABR3KIS0_TRISP
MLVECGQFDWTTMAEKYCRHSNADPTVHCPYVVSAPMRNSGWWNAVSWPALCKRMCNFYHNYFISFI